MSSEDEVYNINNVSLLIPFEQIHPPISTVCIVHIGKCLLGASLGQQTSLGNVVIVPCGTICVLRVDRPK